MKRSRKLVIAGLTAISLLVSVPPAWAADKADSHDMTREEVLQRLLMAADAYSPTALEEGTIMRGDEDGALRETQPVTRAECFVMISRAFGTLPEPKGHDKRVSFTNLVYTDVPSWAIEDVENLVKGGILAGTEGGSLKANEPVTSSQLEFMLQRIWQLFGSNVRDDFYSTVNKETLDNSVIDDGFDTESAQDQMNRRNDEKLTTLLEDIVSQEQKPGTPQQKIADYLSSARDFETRDQLDIQPIQKYLDLVDRAQSVEELFQVHHTILRETGIAALLDFQFNKDAEDANSSIPVLLCNSPALSHSLYEAGEDGTVQTASRQLLEKQLIYLGETEKDAARHAKLVYDLDARLAEKQLSPKDQYNVDKIYNPRTFEELEALYPSADLKSLLKACSVERTPPKFNIMDLGLIEAFAKEINEQNLETLKAKLKTSLAAEAGEQLSLKFAEAEWDFSKVYNGMQGSYDPEDAAKDATMSQLSCYIEEAYAEKYCSPEIKADVTEMVKEYIAAFRGRVQKLDWMSEQTKEKALKKLDTMKIHVGYPDQFSTDLDGAEILGAADEENRYFQNACALRRAQYQADALQAGEMADKDIWPMPIYRAGAGYVPTDNSINFPAGILQQPYYDPSASRETNLGGVGVVIGHEITHAFDNSGSKFDEKGNAVNWWTEEDRAAFDGLCEKMIAYYDGYEIAPGIALDGQQTLGENIADTGGIGCSLELLGRMENPDYDAFFRNFARGSCFTAERSRLELVVTTDVHSRAKGRVNPPIACYEEFYKTYDVQPGDGMYVAPEDRVRIW